MAADEGRIRAVLADAIDSVRRDMVSRLKAVMP
jgi:hypothetical protein